MPGDVHLAPVAGGDTRPAAWLLLGTHHPLVPPDAQGAPILVAAEPVAPAVPAVTRRLPERAPGPAQCWQDASGPRTDPARPDRPAGELEYSGPGTDRLDAQGGRALCRHTDSTHSAAAFGIPCRCSRR